MAKIIPNSRPKMSKSDVEKILLHHNIPLVCSSVVWIRGYYLNSIGKKDVNDINVYDDACFIISPTYFQSFNANTDPNRVWRGGRALAKLALGRYEFYRGKHKGKYSALRAFPEGVKMPCTRAGKISTCSYINQHKGSSNRFASNVTWSEGCLTIPSSQYGEWQKNVYEQMRIHPQKTGRIGSSEVKLIDTLLVENLNITEQRIYDSQHKVIL